MILVSKGPIPGKLRREGADAHNKLMARFQAGPAAFQPPKPVKFREGLYGHKDVRKKLREDQYGKCCYCEVRIPTPYALCHVEHFRPKAFSRQSAEDPAVYPGYFWLVYDWTNLFLSCGFCNSSHKKNLFPLTNPATRATPAQPDIAAEDPVLLYPTGPEDPRLHIKFHNELIVPLTDRGKEIIKILKLDDEQHDESRRTHLAKLRGWLHDIRFHSGDPRPEVQAKVAEARQSLIQAILPRAQFSAMAQDFLRENPIPDQV